MCERPLIFHFSLLPESLTVDYSMNLLLDVFWTLTCFRHHSGGFERPKKYLVWICSMMVFIRLRYNQNMQVGMMLWSSLWQISGNWLWKSWRCWPRGEIGKNTCEPFLVFSGRECFLWCSLFALPEKINHLDYCVTIWYICFTISKHGLRNIRLGIQWLLKSN